MKEIQETIKHVQAAVKELSKARLRGEQSVKQHGILVMLQDQVRRLLALDEEIGPKRGGDKDAR